MIKKFKQYNESIRNLLVGPTEDEVLKSLINLPPYELLVKSCEIGLIKGIKLALGQGIKHDDRFKHLLETNIKLNNVKTVELLIESSDIYFVMDTINNNLKRCCNYESYLNMIKLLLKYITDIHYMDDVFLLNAIEHNNDNIVKILIDNGADVNNGRPGETPLKIALKYHFHKIIILLLSDNYDFSSDTDRLKQYLYEINVTKDEINNIQWDNKKQTIKKIISLINKYIKKWQN